MSLKKLRLKTRLDHRGQRLDHVLAQWLPGVLKQDISKGKVRKLIIAGAVYLNGKRVRIASKEILAGALLEVYIDLTKLLATAQGGAFDAVCQFEMTSDRVLFEDEDLIIVDKPAGVPTQPTLDEARVNLYRSVKKFLSDRSGGKDVYVGLHHRLDRDTSGVILFTKTKKINIEIAKIFSSHQARKTYFALTSAPVGRFPSHWVVENHLAKLKTAGKRSKFGSVRSGGDYARTEFQVIEQLSGGAGLWVEASPLTGRTHQIRVHLSEGGTPIDGDIHYGGRKSFGPISFPRVMLHAAKLEFIHPFSHNNLEINSPLPKDFQQCLKALRGENSGF